MSYGLLNVSSIFFGAIALIIPLTNLILQKKNGTKNLGISISASIGACAISLCMEILYANHLVSIEDFTALMDLLPTVTTISIGLLAATILLNIVTYVKCNKKSIV